MKLTRHSCWNAALTIRRSFPGRGGRSLAGVVLFSACLSAGCLSPVAQRRVERSAAPSAGRFWKPADVESSVPLSLSAASAVPERWTHLATTLSLEDAVDLALRNNPRTKVAWHLARAAAAEAGSKRAAYYPEIELSGQISRRKEAGAQTPLLQTTYGTAAAISWLLLDAGGRGAEADESSRALEAANRTHDAVIQGVVFDVEQIYYRYLAAKALDSSYRASFAEVKTNLDAATERHRAGVATIADVLQAKTAYSQVELSLVGIEGEIQVVRGALATALGVPADVPVEVGDLPDLPDPGPMVEAVDRLIARAAAERPDLLAARSAALQADDHARSIFSEGLPSLSAAAVAGRTHFDPSSSAGWGNSYSGALVLRVPLFNGFASTFNTLKAREEADAAHERVENIGRQVILDVWTSYYGLKTAAQKITASRDLLDSARQSEDVGRGRYKAGVGSILDLLTAESSLAAARAQEVSARAEWLLAVARLAYATGRLVPPSQAPIQTIPPKHEEKD